MKLKSYYNPTRDARLTQTVQIRLAADAAPATSPSLPKTARASRLPSW